MNSNNSSPVNASRNKAMRNSTTRMITMRSPFTALSVVYFEFAAFATLAAAQNPTLAQPAPGAGATLEQFIGLLIRIMQAVLTPFLVVCIIYAGYLIVTAGGNEEKVTKGKTVIFWTLIGAAIIIGAQVIADMVYGTADQFN